ncbi:MAG: hypothetical protein RI980_948 [Bacteroidota bacterium]|jgi:membrane protein YdbS with pleckstrin-like domain|nr:MAG: hypothetical protein EAY77_06260 [Flavobacteriia bacterium]
MKNFNLKRFIIEMLIYAIIFGVIMYFAEYKDVQKSITAGIFYGLSMSIFNSFILPKLQKKK